MIEPFYVLCCQSVEPSSDTTLICLCHVIICRQKLPLQQLHPLKWWQWLQNRSLPVEVPYINSHQRSLWPLILRTPLTAVLTCVLITRSHNPISTSSSRWRRSSAGHSSLCLPSPSPHTIQCLASDRHNIQLIIGTNQPVDQRQRV